MFARRSRPSTPLSIESSSEPEFTCPRPTLCSVLCDRSPSPWTLAAFTSFLARNFCGEVLSFTTAVIAYRNVYALLQASTDSAERDGLNRKAFRAWEKLIETYIVSNAPSEINIQGVTRNALLQLSGSAREMREPPSPDVLQVAYDSMYDLLGGVFVQFVESIDARHMHGPNCGSNTSHPCGNYRTAMVLEPDMPLPEHRRAHGLWGGSRVYRKIISRRSKESPALTNKSGDIESKE